MTVTLYVIYIIFNVLLISVFIILRDLTRFTSSKNFTEFFKKVRSNESDCIIFTFWSFLSLMGPYFTLTIFIILIINMIWFGVPYVLFNSIKYVINFIKSFQN
jgi:hypothetical protein